MRSVKIFWVIIFFQAFTALAFGGVTLEKPIDTDSAELFAQSDAFNNQIVSLKGEVIGDMMPRENGVWLSLQDKYNTLSVWASPDMAKKISHTGSYQYRGDTIEVIGEFRKADPSLGGEMYIQAHEIKIVQQGERIFHELSPLKKELALILSFAVVGLGILKRLVERRGKNKSPKGILT